MNIILSGQLSVTYLLPVLWLEWQSIPCEYCINCAYCAINSFQRQPKVTLVIHCKHEPSATPLHKDLARCIKVCSSSLTPFHVPYFFSNCIAIKACLFCADAAEYFVCSPKCPGFALGIWKSDLFGISYARSLNLRLLLATRLRLSRSLIALDFHSWLIFHGRFLYHGNTKK